jgi:carboxypeptidase family protein
VIPLVLALGLLLQGAPGGRGATTQGAVTGQIQTRDGAPATAVRVAAIPAPPPQSGIRPDDGIQYYIPPPPVRVTQTDEQGRYRLANIPPGRYLIAAGLVGLATYHPGQIDALRASVVTVTADAPATVDFKLVTPLGGRVSGRVTPPPTQGSGEIAVMSGVTLAEVAEIAVTADGQFAFGRVPPGRYLVSIFPTPAGYGSLTVDVREADVTALEIKRPATHVVSGRVVTTNGPIPTGLLALVTDTSYVPIIIKPDGTFTARAHSARHRIDFGGMPSGYAMTSVRVGGRDVAGTLTVGTSDISGVVVNVTAPRGLPRIRGTIAGLSKPVTVEMTGPIVGTLTAITKNGAFEIPAATPGLYYLRVRELPQLGTTHVAVTWNGGGNVQLKAP